MSNQQPPSSASGTNADPAELAALRAENAALQAELAAYAASADRGVGVRGVVTWVLVALSLVAVLASFHAVWLQTTIADEDRFVATFAPLTEEPAVVTALSQRLADELIIAADVVGVLEGILPRNLAVLAAPVAEGLRDLTADVANEVISSEVFAGIWRQALRLSHNTASLVLSTDGRVSIDLNEAAGEVVGELEARGVTLVSGVVVELPEIVLFQNDQLESAAGALRLVDTMGWFLPLLALALIAAAIAVASDRRRTTAVIGFGTAVASLVTLVVVRLVRGATVSTLPDDTNRAAAEAIWDTTLRFHRQSLWALMLVGLLVGFLAWIGGHSHRAVATRAWWNTTIDQLRGPDATVPSSGFARFLAAWQGPIQWAAIILGLLFLLVVPAPSGLLVIATAFVVTAIVVLVQVIGGPDRATVSVEVLVLEAEEVEEPPAGL
ncbi:MAG TPA: hypothetical protein VLG28_12405 [Acidimicrobiia bacterium]|nr:hypothetical protein [Acidimicrobiia bacterium]